MTTNETNPRAERLSDIVTFMQNEMGINPMTLYCQFTGKPIGRLFQDEIESLVDMDTDIEQISDDFMIRTLASMRPSVYWNVMRSDSLLDAMRDRPVETLAYLLNRLFQPNDWLSLPMARRMDDLHQRIRLYHHLFNEMGAAKRSDLFEKLIEIDAKMNLSRQHINLRATDLILFEDESLTLIDEWYGDCIKRYNRAQKQESDNLRSWVKGNTLARPAFVRSFLDAKPESKTATVKREKKAANKDVDLLFAAVMAQVESSPYIATPLPAAVKPVASSTRIPSFLIRKAG